MPARSGGKHHAAKLSEATVRAARVSYAKGTFILVEGKREPVTYSSLARKYGVRPQTMREALTGKTWRHVS